MRGYGALVASPVLLCTDGSELSIEALRAGLDLLRPGEELVLVTVVDQPDPTLVTGTGIAGGVMSATEYERLADAGREEAAVDLDRTASALGIEQVERRVVDGAPGPGICNLAETIDAKAIILGSRGRGGLKRAVLGSVSDHVVRNAPCPVIVSGPRAT